MIITVQKHIFQLFELPLSPTTAPYLGHFADFSSSKSSGPIAAIVYQMTMTTTGKLEKKGA